MSSEGTDRVVTLLREHGPLAPPRLRARVEAELARAEKRRSVVRPALSFAAGAALASLAFVLAVFAPSLLPDEPDALDVHALLGEGPAGPAPAPRSSDSGLLAAELEGVAFPNWRREFGWRAVGRRSDDLSGRAAETVFYEHEGHMIAYTIVSGPPLEVPADAKTRRVDGVVLRQFTDGHLHDVVVFERKGKTCVLSGHVDHHSTLVDLATWRGKGELAF